MLVHFKQIFTTKWVAWSLSIIGVIAIISTIFFLGLSFGHQRANYRCDFGDRYEKMFFGDNENDRMAPGFNPRNNVRAFGATGKIISIATSTLIIEDISGVEKIIVTDSDTDIKSMKNSLSSTDLKIGDNVTIFGEPTKDGSISAKLIRVMPENFRANNQPIDSNFKCPNMTNRQGSINTTTAGCAANNTGNIK